MLLTRPLILFCIVLSGCSLNQHSAETKIESRNANSSQAETSSAPYNQIRHTILFASGSAALPTDLAQIVVPHSRHLIINPYTRVLVEGMANDTTSFEDNMALGLRRAEAVKKALESLGVDPSQIIVKSSGNLRPQSELRPERSRCVVLSY